MAHKFAEDKHSKVYQVTVIPLTFAFSSWSLTSGVLMANGDHNALPLICVVHAVPNFGFIASIGSPCFDLRLHMTDLWTIFRKRASCGMTCAFRRRRIWILQTCKTMFVPNDKCRLSATESKMKVGYSNTRLTQNWAYELVNQINLQIRHTKTMHMVPFIASSCQSLACV